MLNKKYARCLICNQEFTKEEIKECISCPKCGNKGLPSNLKEDVIVKINWHELHILCVWAENWARQIKDISDTQPQLTISCIAKRIQKQYPNKTPLTLAGEIEEVKKEFPTIETNIDDKP